jgi:nucleoside-diphosphate-sugar epimerase
MGVMGSRMAARLLAAGFDVTVWNRSPSKALPLADRGAAVASTPAEAATGKDVVFANLTDGEGPALGHHQPGRRARSRAAARDAGRHGDHRAA